MHKVDTSKELDKFFAKHPDLAPKITIAYALANIVCCMKCAMGRF